jgi:hypothetical protein
MEKDRKQLTEFSACTREFLAISRSMETSTVSLAGRRWSELGVEVVISGIVRPVARYLWTDGFIYDTLFIWCSSSHSVLSSSLHSHSFLLLVQTGAFLALPTSPVSL